MRTLTRFVAAVVTAAVAPACSVIASSVAHADPVATTATVLKVVDGTRSTSATMSGVGYASACWASIPLKPRSPATPWAAGVRRQPSSRSRPCLGNVSPSSPIRARACMTATAGPWPTWTRPTVGTTRSKRRVRVLPIPTSITAIHRPEPTRLGLPNRERRPRAGACGDRRASAKRRQSQSDSPRCLRSTVRPRGRALTGRAVPPGRGCRRAGVHHRSRGCAVYGWG